MRASTGFAALLLSLALSLAACGATLTRGPAGWHESPTPYSIAPLEAGGLLPAGWALYGYSVEKDGFRRGEEVPSKIDLKIQRVEDDGILVVTHDRLAGEDGAKRPDVLADRWIDHVVRNPKADDDDGAIDLFAPVVPKLETTATGTVGFRALSSTVLRGRTVQVDSRESFPLPGGEGAEITATLSPVGSSPDRRVYVAIIKQAGGTSYAIVAYGNTPTMFENGLPDAAAFAHRIRF